MRTFGLYVLLLALMYAIAFFLLPFTTESEIIMSLITSWVLYNLIKAEGII